MSIFTGALAEQTADLTNALEGLTKEEAAAGGAALGMAVGMIFVLAIVWFIFQAIADWKIFTKAGEAGWKSIIPIYNEYVEWKISWSNITLFWAYIGLAVVGVILYSMDASAAASNGGNLGFLGIIGCIGLLAGCVLKLVQTYKLFQSFGKGLGWFIGYIFLNSIMILVLGFGSSEYQGPQD
jgi:hypothetical protein